MELRQLIQDCVAGKRQAQNTLYERFARPLMAVCLRYSKNREEAEDILQEGFILAFSNLHQFKFEGAFEGWLRRIMVNRALKKHSSKSHLHAIVPIDAYSYNEPSTDEKAHSELSAKELLSMVQQLPKAYRLIFNLYVFEGLKHREIATLLGISAGTSKSNLSDARRLLQRAVAGSQVKKKAA
jgi:RNA polymerase sigma factor (sigma-70 family)